MRNLVIDNGSGSSEIIVKNTSENEKNGASVQNVARSQIFEVRFETNIQAQGTGCKSSMDIDPHYNEGNEKDFSVLATHGTNDAFSKKELNIFQMSDSYIPQFDNMPNDIIIKILKYCQPDQRSVATLCCCCRRFRTLARKYQRQWKFENAMQNSVIAAVGLFPLLTSVDILNCKFTDEELDSLGQLEKLTRIRIESCAFLCGSALKDLHKLETIELSNCYQVTDSLVDYIVDKKIKSLTCYNLIHFMGYGFNVFNHFRRPPYLQTFLVKLDLSKCQRVTDSNIQFITNLINLEILNLSDCYRITDAALSHLSSLNRLKDLKLVNCRFITPQNLLAYLLDHQLVKLDVTGCCRIQLDTLVNITYSHLVEELTPII